MNCYFEGVLNLSWNTKLSISCTDTTMKWSIKRCRNTPDLLRYKDKKWSTNVTEDCCYSVAEWGACILHVLHRFRFLESTWRNPGPTTMMSGWQEDHNVGINDHSKLLFQQNLLFCRRVGAVVQLPSHSSTQRAFERAVKKKTKTNDRHSEFLIDIIPLFVWNCLWFKLLFLPQRHSSIAT